MQQVLSTNPICSVALSIKKFSATYAQLAFERATHNGNPALMYSSYPPASSHRPVAQSGPVTHGGQPYCSNALYEQQPHQAQQYYQNYGVGPVSPYGGNAAPQYMPQQAVMSTSAPPYSDHESTSNIQPQVCFPDLAPW